MIHKNNVNTSSFMKRSRNVVKYCSEYKYIKYNYIEIIHKITFSAGYFSYILMGE